MAIRLSVVVITYRLSHQIENTLKSLLPPYQKNVRTDEYEILLVDNGSPGLLPPRPSAMAENIHYRYIPPQKASPSPVRAINHAVQTAKAPVVCIMIDGARMVTPGVLDWGLRLLECDPEGAAEAREWHLGPKKQYESLLEGYNDEVEKELLRKINWQQNGYRLFEISTATRPQDQVYFGRVRESSCVFMSKALFERVGGYDERYSQPGGGHANIDFFWRLAEKASRIYTILGEGTFHQTHGGAVTGKSYIQLAAQLPGWWEEYEKLSRPRDLEVPYRPAAIGHLPKECRSGLGFEIVASSRNLLDKTTDRLRTLAGI